MVGALAVLLIGRVFPETQNALTLRARAMVRQALMPVDPHTLPPVRAPSNQISDLFIVAIRFGKNWSASF